jgi:hypothetical protein
MAAVRHATTPGTATPSSKSCSTGNQPKPTRTSARSWSGRSRASWRKTVLGRSSFTIALPTAGSLRSRVGR